ncbi:hypothetical protein JGU72_20195 [Antrihabitans sp. YC2-6]|nr:hypothetical protein [Antrihabitans sp. YC2-6]
MRGSIRLGRWRSFEATQLLSPSRGYVWAATTKVAGLPISGYDRFTDGDGEMRWRIGGIVPVMSAAGFDVSRSAAGRAAAECVLVPTSFSGAMWADDGPSETVATWVYESGEENVRLRLASDGSLQRLSMQRWGNPDGAGYRRHPFGVSVEETGTFEGVVIPTRLRAGWWFGTDRQDEGEFFRAEILSAHFC